MIEMCRPKLRSFSYVQMKDRINSLNLLDWPFSIVSYTIIFIMIVFFYDKCMIVFSERYDWFSPAS